MKFHVCALAAAFFFSIQLRGQDKLRLDSILQGFVQKNRAIDSLVQITRKPEDDTVKVIAYARLFNSFLYNAPELAKYFAQRELEVAEKIDYAKGLGWSNFHLSAFYQNAGNMDSATYYMKKAMAIGQQTENVDMYASGLTTLASFDYIEGRYQAALSKYDQALDAFRDVDMYKYAITQGEKANVFVDQGYYKLALEETLSALRVLDTVYNKPWRKADAQRMVGQIEFQRANYRNSLEYYQSAAEIYEQQDDKVFMARIYNDIGDVHFHLNDTERARRYFEQSLELSIANGISDNEGNTLSNLGKVYTREGRPDKALEYLNRALEIHTKNNYRANTLWTQNEIGQAYLAMGRVPEAISYLTKTVDSAIGKGPLADLKNAYEIRYKALMRNGQTEKAIQDLLMFQVLKDSIFNSAKSRQIEELRTIYETEKKEQQLALQETEIAVLEQRAEIIKLQRLLLGAGLGLTLLFFSMGFYGLRQKVRRTRLEKEKLDAELAFKKKELTTHALHLAKKNEVLEGLKQKAQELRAREPSKSGYQQLIRTINFDLKDDNNWENFARYFEEVHKDFNRNVKTKYPQVTSNELRLLALLKMNLSSKEIASILNISQEGIKKARYRMRKKLDISTEESLQDLVLSL